VVAHVSAKTRARLVQKIGRVLLFYRPHDDPDDRRIHLPKKKPKAED
jgi:RNA-binding protein YhbY